MNSVLKEDIIAILSDELDTYKVILAKTSQQIEMIKTMDMDGLQTIFHEKDKCINKIEEECYTELAILQAGIAAEILQADKGIHASKAYNSPNTSPPRFFDIRS